MPSVLFKFGEQSSSEMKRGRTSVPGSGESASSLRSDLKARVSEREKARETARLAQEQARADTERRTKQEALATLQRQEQQEAAERVEALRTGVLLTHHEAKNDLFNEKIPLATRRLQAERASSAAMEAYLLAQKNVEPARIANATEKTAIIKNPMEALYAGQALDAALLREVFAETEHPKEAFDAYMKVKSLEKELKQDPQLEVIKSTLEQARKAQNEEYITSKMVDALPPNQREQARKWLAVEATNRETNFHIERLKTWHEKKTTLDLARREALTHCKSCNIPDEIVKQITDPSLSYEQRQINLNRTTSDGPLRELDKPSSLKERFIGAGLKLARAFGISTERQFVNEELNQRMTRVAKLQKEFNAVADTKGAFVGRRPQYQSRLVDQLQSPLTYIGQKREAVIGGFQRASESERDPYHLEEMHQLTEQIRSITQRLERRGNKLTQEDVNTAQDQLEYLREEQSRLGGTNAKNTGEFIGLEEALNNARTLIQKQRRVLTKLERSTSKETARITKEETAKQEKLLQTISQITNDVSALTRYLEDQAENISPLEYLKSKTTFDELALAFVRLDKDTLPKQRLETVQEMLRSTEELLKEAEFSSKHIYKAQSSPSTARSAMSRGRGKMQKAA